MHTHPFIAAGIDGGGTQTRVVLVDEHGRVLGIGLSGPANYHSVGLATAERNLSTAIEAAWKEAGQTPRFCDRAFLGLAGVATDEDRTRLMQIALRLGIAPENRIEIDHDMRIALAGAMPDRLNSTGGIVLIAGTGSVAFGHSPATKEPSTQEGPTKKRSGAFFKADDPERYPSKNAPDPFSVARAGGMGHVFDDAGSGYDIGRRAVSAAIRAADGRGQTTSLGAIIEQAFGGNLRQIVTGLSFVAAKRENIARLAPHVLDAAQQGDAVADTILRNAANELALCVFAVAEQLFSTQCPATAAAEFHHVTPVAITGGLATPGSPLIPYIHRAVAARLPRVEWIEPAMEPVLGAAWLALSQSGIASLKDLKAIEENLRSQSDMKPIA